MRAGGPRRRPGPPPIPWVGTALWVGFLVGLVATVGLALSQETRSSLAQPGGWFDAVGRLAGLTGTYLMLVMVVLIARVPWLERSIGQDRLVRWHRRIGGWPIALIALHVLTVTMGYAALTKVSFFSQLWTFMVHYPDILAAVVAFCLLIVAGVSSARIARRRMRYETWWVVHLYIYLALGLSFAHQVATGAMFLGDALSTIAWTALWIVVGVSLLGSRLALPLVRNVRYRLRVVSVDEVAPSVYAVTLRGRQLSRLAVSGGQFFQWRFLSRGLWWHSHPYSLSALPRPPHLRVTVRALGDQSRAIARLRRGTRALVEGPYGTFTTHARETEAVTLIGAGVGTTPLRALAEDLPRGTRVTAILRASSKQDRVHHDEIAAIVRRHDGVLHELIGSRREVRLDARALKRLAPDVAKSDVFVCGPEGFLESVRRAASAAGVPDERIHAEAFAF
jgi:predicted ferric reductase